MSAEQKQVRDDAAKVIRSWSENLQVTEEQIARDLGVLPDTLRSFLDGKNIPLQSEKQIFDSMYQYAGALYDLDPELDPQRQQVASSIRTDLPGYIGSQTDDLDKGRVMILALSDSAGLTPDQLAQDFGVPADTLKDFVKGRDIPKASLGKIFNAMREINDGILELRDDA